MQRLTASLGNAGKGRQSQDEGRDMVGEFGRTASNASGSQSQSYPARARQSHSFDREGPTSTGGSDAGLPSVPPDPRRRISSNRRRMSSGQDFSQRAASASASAATAQSGSPRVQSPSASAALHSLPAVAQLLNAHKVYRAGYVYRLDNDPNASTKGHQHSSSVGSAGSASAAASVERPAFVKYYMRLEDCILCLWSDEGLRKAQAQGRVIHPISMNLIEGFASLASAKNEWLQRCNQAEAPTPFSFVLNTAGNNAVIFCCESEEDMRAWVNSIRLAVWERSRLEAMYTAARLGIREEQQGQPIRSALTLTNNGAQAGRAEGLLDIRLPGDTEWKRVYAVLTEPRVFAANKHLGPASPTPGSPPPGQTNSSNSTATVKKEKRKSFMGFLTGSSSKHDLSRESSRDAGGKSEASANPSASPMAAAHNQQLEDPSLGPTLAVFGILSGGGTGAGSLPNTPNARQQEFGRGSVSGSSSAPLTLTRCPVVLITDVYSAYAVWPESEALVPHSKLFKLHGRVHYNEHEMTSYAAAPGTNAGRGPMSAFLEALRRENRDAGRAEKQGTILCMHAGKGDEPVGPGNAAKLAANGDAGIETLSWVLAFYDAFRLHGRPDRLIYDPRIPVSPYFCQPVGPGRGRLYFDPSTVEDLPGIEDNRPKEIDARFLRVLVQGMMESGVLSPNQVPRYLLSPSPMPPQNGASRQQSPLPEQDVRAAPMHPNPSASTQESRSATPPVLPPIGESLRVSPRPGSSGQTEIPRSNAASIPDTPSPGLTAGRFMVANQSNEALGPRDYNAARQAAMANDYASPSQVDAYDREGNTPTNDVEPHPSGDQSFSTAFKQAMLPNNVAQGSPQPGQVPLLGSGHVGPAHPRTLTPGGSDSASRKSSLHDGQRAPGFTNGQDQPRNNLYLQQSRSREPEDRTEELGRAALSRESTTAGHYNTVPFRSHTPSSTSMMSGPSSTVQPPPLPGAYRSDTPEQLSDYNGTPAYQAADPWSTGGVRDPPGTTPAGSNESQTASSYDRPRGEMRENLVLSDEPVALYAISLPEEPPRPKPQQEQTSVQRSRPADSVSQALRGRAEASNDFTSPTSAADGQNDIATRASNTPISAYPATSASEYSQANTPVLDQSRSLGESLGDAAPMAPGPVVPPKLDQAQPPLVEANRIDGQDQQRQMRASNAPSTEGGHQDDYLAGMNYLALTENAEPQPTVQTHSPPLRPPRSPRGPSASTKPTIHITTNNGISKAPSQPGVGGSAEASGLNNPLSPSTMSSANSEGPTSPDPYGTYTEQQQASVPALSIRNKGSQSKAPSSHTVQTRQASTSSSSRKPGRKGVPGGRKTGKKLGSWSSDEDNSDTDSGKDEDEEPAEEQNRETAGPAVIPEIRQEQPTSEEFGRRDRRDLEGSVSSTGSRRNLPQLPGPSTDPYINPPRESYSENGRDSPYEGNQSQYQGYGGGHEQRPSMYGWPNQYSGGQAAPWQGQMPMQGMSPLGNSPGSRSPYGHSPSPSIYAGHGSMMGGAQNDTMVGSIPQDPNMAGADARAARQAAVAPHGLLQAGIQGQQARSAAQMEAQAKETGGTLLNIGHKPPPPSGGLMGAIASHENERKRTGGLGATLTDRDRERRAAEARQREMEHMNQRQSGMFGGSPFNWAGMAPMGGFGGGQGYQMDPMQMQQQMAMLAAQNAYLQAMAGFNNPGMGSPGFMSPAFGSPGPGMFGQGGSPAPYAGSYMGMPPSQSPQSFQPRHTPSPSQSRPGQHTRDHSSSRPPNDYYRDQ